MTVSHSDLLCRQNRQSPVREAKAAQPSSTSCIPQQPSPHRHLTDTATRVFPSPSPVSLPEPGYHTSSRPSLCVCKSSRQDVATDAHHHGRAEASPPSRTVNTVSLRYSEATGEHTRAGGPTTAGGPGLGPDFCR